MPSVRCAGRICLVLCWTALLLPLAAQSGSDTAASIADALRNREFDRALQLIEPALRQSPVNPQLFMFQGLAYSGKGDENAALASYQHALRIAPDYLPALEGAAQLEYQSANPAAVPLLEHILRLRPGDLTTHAMIAVMDYRSGDCAGAVDHFAQSRAILEAQPGAMQDYGICLLKLRQTDQGIAIFRQVLASHPDDPRPRRALAAAQLDAGKPQDALTTLQPLLNANPDVNTMELAATVYEANKDTPDAVRVLRDAIVQDPNNTALYVDFASMALDHESFQTGIEMIDAGLRLQPQAADLYLARGVLYVQMAQFDKAEADFEKADELDPKQSLGAAAQGMIAEERNQNNPDRALATVQAKLARSPRDAFLWYLQAAILSQKAPEPGSADFVKGIASAKKAIALDPSLAVAHDLLAKFYLDSGQYAAAARECRLVLQQAPDNQTALYHLVIALRKTNQTGEIPDLLKRLAQARQNATRQEAERNRYKLMVAPDSGGSLNSKGPSLP
jgi:tetratricopeptide (TPR) repeat protein